jgi:ABC-type bacteriocin/lantibiotic exporter with double-glycine peptidase domain
MIYLSLALVIIAVIAGFLVNKWLDQRFEIHKEEKSINKEAIDMALTAATAEMHKQFDSRINKAFENQQGIKSELDSLRMQLALKVRNNG